MNEILLPAWMEWPETRRLITAFAREGVALRFVGGAVRDALLGRSVQDVDAATPLPPQLTLALLEKARIRAIPTGMAHGTVTAVIDKTSFEITTLRKDMTTDGRHAEVSFTDDWKEDALRRDFTMNALYLSPKGELFDYVGGVADARAGHVRFIGNAYQRIGEDYLRILRFFRFYAHYGREEPDSEALTACAVLSERLSALSAERVREEIFKLLAAPVASTALQLMHDKRILAQLLGFDLRDCLMFSRFEAIERLTGQPIEPFVRFSGFILAIGAHMAAEEALEILAERFRLSNSMVKELQLLLAAQKDISAKMTDAQQKMLMRKIGPPRFQRAVSMRWAYGDEPVIAGHPYQAMLALATWWHAPEFCIDGNDLIVLGFEPGKELGDVLRWLEEKWETNDYMLDREQLLAMAKQAL